MIDRYLLRYFLAVVQQGNFSRAAQHCRVSQPTLSVGIAKLEKIVGQLLFNRSNRRVELTAAGSSFLQHARRIEAEFVAAESSVRDVPASKLIRIGIIPTLPVHWIERALAASTVHGSNERVEIVEGRMQELSARMDRSRLDIILGILPTTSAAIPVLTERYAVALPDRHPLASKRQINAVEIAHEPMIVRRHCEALSDVSRFFTSLGSRPFIAARTTNDERAAAFVRTGLGITVMPRCFAQAGIVMADLDGFELSRSIGFEIDRRSRSRVADSERFKAFECGFGTACSSLSNTE